MFLHLSTKNTTKSSSEGNFLLSQSILLARPYKTWQVKNLTFQGILKLYNTKKINKPMGERSTKLHEEEPLQRIKAPYPHISSPTPKGMTIK